ncbi:MAG: DNA cytosine methyltransferase, partial [Deltaproteobacteria bacterium]|nr:DNA cytosine methyltransferase [Deltaproteobacteria bacterium]
NVYGIAYAGKSEGVDFLLRQIKKINKRTGAAYSPVFKILRAADYGVPQIRERFFLVAEREGKQFKFPPPTHGQAGDARQLALAAFPAYRTAWDALGDLADDPSDELRARGRWAELLPSIPEGQNYNWHTDRGGGRPLFGWRRRYWNFLLKLAKNQPSWTIQAQPGPAVGPFHWNSRRLSMREMARLQTFPDDVTILGNLGAVQRQLGNAVPSLLAEVLARAIRQQLLGRRAAAGAPRLLPPLRTPVPMPEPVHAIAHHYLDLLGEHTAHPGTGRGYGAEQRAEA